MEELRGVTSLPKSWSLACHLHSHHLLGMSIPHWQKKLPPQSKWLLPEVCQEAVERAQTRSQATQVQAYTATWGWSLPLPLRVRPTSQGSRGAGLGHLETWGHVCEPSSPGQPEGGTPSFPLSLREGTGVPSFKTTSANLFFSPNSSCLILKYVSGYDEGMSSECLCQQLKINPEPTHGENRTEKELEVVCGLRRTFSKLSYSCSQNEKSRRGQSAVPGAVKRHSRKGSRQTNKGA